MENYISINISYLVHKSRLGQDDFGATFALNKGLIGKYVNNISLPKIETIQKICAHFEISIDDFVNRDLSTPRPYAFRDGKVLMTNEPENNDFKMYSPNYVHLLEQSNLDKDKIIQSLEEKLGVNKSNTA